MNISKLYNQLYEKADKLLKQYNPCNIRIEQNKLVCNNAYMCKTKGESLCCCGCKYLSNNGCTVECLECKLGMCWAGDSIDYTFKNTLVHINISEEFIYKMDKLRKIMRKYKLAGIRRTKEEVLAYQRELIYV